MIQSVGRYRGLCVMLLTVLCGVCAGAPSAVAKCVTHGRKPDLKVTRVELDGVGQPHHVIVSRDGRVTRFGVHVDVTNIGGVAVPRKSRMELSGISRNRRLELSSVTTEALKPCQTQTNVFAIDDVQFPLGNLEIKAKADADKKIKESIELNNILTESIAVIPRQWLVQSFVTTQTNPAFGSAVTSAQDGFYFRFDHPDPGAEEFVYRANGDIMNTQPATEGGCTITGGSKTATHSPWAHSYLRVGANLDYYDSIVDAAAEPKYTATLSCPGGFSSPVTGGFTDLTTDGRKPMVENDTTLTGTASPLPLTTVSWTFTADVR